MNRNINVETGEIFLSHNKYMNPPKEKFHLCINDKMYLLINSKPCGFNCAITPEDCSLLKHISYINCISIRIEPIKEFKIIKKEQLSSEAILRLIEKINYSPSLTTFQKETVISELQNCLNQR